MWSDSILASLSSGVRLAMVTVIFSSSLLPSLSLPMSSVKSLKLLLSHNILHSYPTLSRPLLTQSSHRILCLPRLLFPPLSVHLISLPGFHLPLFPRDRPIQPNPHQFLLKPFFHYNLHSQFVHMQWWTCVYEYSSCIN